ncbi:MAG TPA: hypothetical protein VFB58_13130 [Chloroflexota bacterium]|nr:hypothetical protein [Chloroflexota bacterium]
MIDLQGVQPGMDVHDSNGDKIGTVASVATTWKGGSGLDETSIDVDAGSTPNTYIKVQNGRTIWVPANQVTGVDPGKSVTLACERFTCYETYELEPPGLTADSQPGS